MRNEAALRRAYRRYDVARGQEQIAATYPELRWPLLQAYLPSAQRCVYSVSGIKDADRGVLTAVVTSKREQWPPHVGVSTAQVPCNDDRILSVGLRTVDQLISREIFELELLTDGHRLLAIDLNPRAFGFIMLDIAVGNDLPWLWWQTTFGAVDPCRIPGQLPETESRLAVPYYFAQWSVSCWVRAVAGPDPVRGSAMCRGFRCSASQRSASNAARSFASAASGTPSGRAAQAS